MTAEAFSSVPFSAGAAVASAIGRLALSGLAVYMRAPLRNTATLGLVTLCAMAGSNALYRQAHHHPAPLFGNFETTAESQGADPVMPAAKPKKLEKVAPKVVAPAIAKPVAATKAIGNDDVLAIQQKLQALGLLDGKVDGLFGPRTIRAIKAFEAKAGQPVKGQLTPEIVALIKSTSAFAAPDPVAEPAAVPKVTEPVVDAPAASAPLALTTTASAAKVTAVVEPVVETDPLPAPAPLVSAPKIAAASIEPVAATEITAAVAASAPLPEATPVVDAGTTAVAKRSVQTIAVRATPAPAPQAMPDALDAGTAGPNASTDPKVVAAIQRGLASLGFLHGIADGVAGEATAKAIRNFEIYFNYDVTGRITPDLVKLLVQNGAII